MIAVNVTDVDGVTINGTSGNDTINATTTVAGQPFPTNEEDTLDGGAGADGCRAAKATTPTSSTTPVTW
jgi:hypothetical protein